MKKAITIISTLACMQLGAAEIDAFTNRFAPLKDSLKIVNKLTNEMLKESVEEANSQDAGCSEKILYKSLRKKFNNHYRGELTSFIIKSDTIPKVVTDSKDSIYQDFSMFDAIVQGGISHISDPIADLMKVGGVLVGTDKFEHFLGSGFNYFIKYYVENAPVEEALMIGWKAENGILGAVTTGVMSYGDLAANFNGMRFWNHMLLNNDDVLGAKYNLGPYVTCTGNKWETTEEKIDWKNYIDAAFDEGINCSRWKNEKVAEKVKARLVELSANDKQGRTYTCPMEPEALDELAPKYGKLAPYLLNPYGNNPRGVEEFDSLYPAP